MNNPPPNAVTPVFHNLYDISCEWHRIAEKFPKRDRYTLGERIFTEFISGLSAITRAQYSTHTQKLPHLFTASQHINTAVILIRMCNTLELLPDKRYFAIAKIVTDIGKQIGGWIRDIQNHR